MRRSVCSIATCVAGGDESIRLALLHQVEPHVHRGILFLAHRLAGLVRHGDRLAGVHNAQRKAGRFVPGQFGLDPGLVADENNGVTPGAGGSYSAGNVRFWVGVAAHGVYDNAHSGRLVIWRLEIRGEDTPY
jgi:hypothetical protein